VLSLSLKSLHGIDIRGGNEGDREAGDGRRGDGGRVDGTGGGGFGKCIGAGISGGRDGGGLHRQRTQRRRRAERAARPRRNVRVEGRRPRGVSAGGVGGADEGAATGSHVGG